MMRKLNRSVRRAALLAGCCGVLAALAARGEEAAPAGGLEKPSVSLSLDYANKYVWRGLVSNNDPVLQPSLTVGWYGFSANVWGNVDTTDYGKDAYGADREWKFSEIDYTLSYGYTFAKDKYNLPTSLAVNGGIVKYTFDGTSLEDTTEVFVGAGLPDVFLAPSLTAYFDIDESRGVYLSGSVSHTISLVKRGEADALSLILGASLGWGDKQNNEFYYGGTYQDGLADAGVSATLKWSVTDNFAVSPYVKYTDIVTKSLRDVRDDQPDMSSEQLVVGINATYSF